MKMAIPLDSPNLYYFVDDATLNVIVTPNLEDGSSMIYLGTSNNPNYKMAVSAFVQRGKIKSGYSIRVL